jgi:hypothetical protein
VTKPRAARDFSATAHLQGDPAAGQCGVNEPILKTSGNRWDYDCGPVRRGRLGVALWLSRRSTIVIAGVALAALHRTA